MVFCDTGSLLGYENEWSAVIKHIINTLTIFEILRKIFLCYVAYVYCMSALSLLVP